MNCLEGRGAVMRKCRLGLGVRGLDSSERVPQGTAPIQSKARRFCLSCNIGCHKMQVPRMDIIKQLETYRLEHRIPQQELAKKLGVAFSTVNRWLNGKSKPSKIQAYHIEKLLNERTDTHA